jgi:hypothetical protein
MGVHGRLETVDADRETLLGRGDGGHDIGGLGALGGAELVAQAADGGIELAGADTSVEDGWLIHITSGGASAGRGDAGPDARGEGRTSVHVLGLRLGQAGVKRETSRMFGKANERMGSVGTCRCLASYGTLPQ